jgi:hypothetical protein
MSSQGAVAAHPALTRSNRGLPPIAPDLPTLATESDAMVTNLNPFRAWVTSVHRYRIEVCACHGMNHAFRWTGRL